MKRCLFLRDTLALELLDAVVELAGDKGKWHDPGHVHLWAEYVHVEVELLADGLDILETFLVVWSCATHPDLDLVLVEERSNLTESANDTLECACDLQCCLSVAFLCNRSLLNLRW